MTNPKPLDQMMDFFRNVFRAMPRADVERAHQNPAAVSGLLVQNAPPPQPAPPPPAPTLQLLYPNYSDQAVGHFRTVLYTAGLAVGYTAPVPGFDISGAVEKIHVRMGGGGGGHGDRNRAAVRGVVQDAYNAGYAINDPDVLSALWSLTSAIVSADHQSDSGERDNDNQRIATTSFSDFTGNPQTRGNK